MTEDLTIPAVLDRAAREHPDAEAVVDGATRLTYAQLRTRVREAAKAFVAAGVRHGDRIGIWAPNSHRWVVTALGALAAGAVVVPVNTRYKGGEARRMLGGVRLLFTEDGFLGNGYLAMLGDAPPAAVTYDPEPRPGATTWEDFLAAGASVTDGEADARAAAVRPGDVADILFTSGTTGRSKGAMCSHRQDLRTYRAWADRTGLRHGDRYLIVNPLFHSFGYKAGLIACLIRAATMVLQPVFDADETMRLIEAERITVLPGAPTVYITLLDAPGRAGRDLSSLRLAVTGAAVVPVALVRRLRAELFPEVVTAYGLTESCGTVTACSAGDDDETVATTSGGPIEGVEVRIADAAGGPVPTGEDGEILVRGHNVMLGYLGDEAATAAAVRDGWLVTGDRGRLDGRGYLTVTGRSKDMYVTGGFNVYPAEIEQTLAGHDGVAEAAVIGVPDARMGEAGRAYVVARPGAAVTPDDLTGHCRERLAGFKVPREIVLVPALPRNATGKVDKASLAEPAS